MTGNATKENVRRKWKSNVGLSVFNALQVVTMLYRMDERNYYEISADAQAIHENANNVSLMTRAKIHHPAFEIAFSYDIY